MIDFILLFVFIGFIVAFFGLCELLHAAIVWLFAPKAPKKLFDYKL